MLYGRDTDLRDLLALIGGHRLVCVVGAGGIGKSRLAQAAAQLLAGRWPDGAWMVELAGLSDPALLPNAVAQAIDVTLPGNGNAAKKSWSPASRRVPHWWYSTTASTCSTPSPRSFRRCCRAPRTLRSS